MRSGFVGLVLILGAVLMVGCTVLPSGQKSCLYTADSILTTTVKEVRADKAPWTVDPNLPADQKVIVLTNQKKLLVDTMDQVQKNLDEVVKYVEEKEGIIPASSGSN